MCENVDDGDCHIWKWWDVAVMEEMRARDRHTLQLAEKIDNLTFSSDYETQQKLVNLEKMVSELANKNSRFSIGFELVVGVMVIVLGLIGMVVMFNVMAELFADAKCVMFYLYSFQVCHCLLKSGHDDETTTKVIETAMNIIASMNIGDWSQTSRKPGVSCGAAIYIAALSHDIADMGEETITYILNESEAASLTVEELKKREKSILLKKPFTPRPNFDKEVVNCKPKDSKSVGYGLCKDCHKKFIEVSAAFQQAEKERMEREENEEEESESDDPDGDESDNPSGLDGDPVNAPPASTAFEACTRMLDSKGISHMFNHDRLKELLDPSVSKKKEDEEVPEEDEEQDKK
ncbi:hypothetical protein F2Q69_00010268 [Brassica cretica]|uniref:Brf1 TBP-binding domain-containing protein n=1 Tax=Brassica cretica TaxID=69181 RepID=A0A8S9QRH1_BRACR|nr:hypothetical protein F2Q69_00010268 [Brassica cretica]